MTSPPSADNLSNSDTFASSAGEAVYRGRFAPSPSGPLHFGSLVTAVGSYLQARSNRGQWLLRIEDLDPPREQAGAAASILRTLELFGFVWDEEVVYQSTHDEAYRAALEQLATAGLLYSCACSRKEIADQARSGAAGIVYPGHCRGRPLSDEGSWRVHTHDQQIHVHDLLQGKSAWNLEQSYGDFIVRRADGLFAYHLASIVDDAAAGVSDVVRGQDLFSCTPPQIHLQQLLGYSTPRYMHLPIAVSAQGQKLSKQNRARPLDPNQAAHQLAAALRFLGQAAPEHLDSASVSEVWDWALAHWSPAAIPRCTSLPAID